MKKSKQSLNTGGINLLPSFYLYSCVHCNQYYWDVPAMKKHAQTHKWDEQKGQFLCDTCGKESDSLKQFYAHNRLHMEIPKKTFECFMCRKRFTSKHSLKCHMRLHMTTEKIGQQCSICLMIFSRKDALRRHLLIHTGQYIYNCDICGKGFRTAGNLKVSFIDIELLLSILFNENWNYSLADSLPYSYRRKTICLHYL